MRLHSPCKRLCGNSGRSALRNATGVSQRQWRQPTSFRVDLLRRPPKCPAPGRRHWALCSIVPRASAGPLSQCPMDHSRGGPFVALRGSHRPMRRHLCPYPCPWCSGLDLDGDPAPGLVSAVDPSGNHTCGLLTVGQRLEPSAASSQCGTSVAYPQGFDFGAHPVRAVVCHWVEQFGVPDAGGTFEQWCFDQLAESSK